MNKQELRYHLHNLDGLKDEIKRLQEEINNYKGMDIEYFMISVISDMPRSPYSTIQSKVEFAALKRVDYIIKLQQELGYKMLICSAIMAVINMISKDSTEWKIIKCRYFAEQGECNKYDYIARRLMMPERTVYHIENGTICKMLEEYKKKVK